MESYLSCEGKYTVEENGISFLSENRPTHEDVDHRIPYDMILTEDKNCISDHL